MVEEVPGSLEFIEVSFDEGEMEPDKNKEVGEPEPLEEELEGHKNDPEDENLEMTDVDSDSGEEDDDSSNPDYDPSRDR